MRLHQSFFKISMMSVTTLAMGIGSITAMFSIYSQIVLPVSIPSPERVLTVYGASNGINFIPPTISWPKFRMIQSSVTAFTHAGAYSNEAVNMAGDGDITAEQLRGLRVSGNFFSAVQAVPFRGRLFVPEDDIPNGPAVCILSYELWQARFGGRDLIGSTIQLSGKSTQVVGILAPRFSRPWADRQVFLPRVFEDSGLTPQAVENGATFLEVIGRLRPGATPRQAAGQLRGLSREYTSRFGNRNDSSSHLEERPLVETVTGRRGPVFLALLGGVGVVLLISCVNAAALFLSRLISREREIGVRQALGATRSRIVMHFLGESMGTAAVAGVIGFMAALATLRIAMTTIGAELPSGVQLELDGVAALAGFGAVLVCGALVGTVPSLYATRAAKRSPLAAFARGGSEGTRTRDFRALLVTVEVALSAFLLVGTSLLTASLNQLQHTSPGFEPAGVGAAFVNLSGNRYASPERQEAFFSGVVDRLKGNRQVKGAAVVFGLPFHDENSASTYTVSGRPILAPADRERAGLRMVSEDYFQVMRIRVVAGRGFRAEDRAGAPLVCIVNESLARRQFRGGSAIGQVIRRGRNADQLHEIVGVVADVKTNGLQQPTPDEIFYPFRQLPRATAAIVARAPGDPAPLGRIIQQAASEVDPNQPVSRFATMDSRLDGTLGTERVAAGVTGAFAGVALLLSAIGLYAILAHSVAARRTEIGIRMAIGAKRDTVMRLILAQGLRLVGAGLGAGLIAAAAASRVLASQLYEIDPHDPVIYAMVAGVFTLVGVAASLAPALRASRVDPLTALQRH